MTNSITIIRSSTAEQDDVHDLAELDSRRAPGAPLLMAYVDGELRAALGLADGRMVADPFHATDDVVRLLRRAADSEEVSRAA